MINGEAALGPEEQVQTSVSNVTAVQKTGTKFCAYHSHGNQKANHETKDCKAINGSFAIPDPMGGQCYVNKDTKEYFKAKRPEVPERSESDPTTTQTPRITRNPQKNVLSV